MDGFEKFFFSVLLMSCLVSGAVSYVAFHFLVRYW